MPAARSARRRRPRPIALAAVAAAALAAALLALTGCGGNGDDWSGPHVRPTAVGTLGVGFTDPDRPPTPEATVTPRPGSWNAVRPSKDYRVVLLRAGSDQPTTTLATAVTDWAHDVDAELKTVTAAHSGDLITAITKAINLKPDLIVSVGNSLVDPLAIATANHLDQQFLTVGSEVAEPTANVTAADWTGASFRGEGLGLPNAYNPATFTPERAGRAVRAGVAAVLHGITGIVLRID